MPFRLTWFKHNFLCSPNLKKTEGYSLLRQEHYFYGANRDSYQMTNRIRLLPRYTPYRKPGNLPKVSAVALFRSYHAFGAFLEWYIVSAGNTTIKTRRLIKYQTALRPYAAPHSALQFILTSIDRGFAFSLFGNVSSSTPLFIDAFIFSVSTSSGSANDRLNRP